MFQDFGIDVEGYFLGYILTEITYSLQLFYYRIELKCCFYNLRAVSREVDEWKKATTKQQKKRRKMEVFRKEFLTNVFHELKTPVFNIQGYLETLLEGAMNDKNVNTQFLQKANQNVERIATIVEDLQLISNLKEGCNVSFMVKADREMIHQVLNNLVSNSIKYGKEGGRTQIGLYDMNENILVEVSDNGIGIEQVHLSRIFERFYRVDKDRSRKQGGSGLGLSIVKHIIERHGMTVNVRSTIEVGSTFGFTLHKA